MEHCYIAKEKCGCITGVVVDNPARLDGVAEDVADFIKSGRTIERVSLKDIRKNHLGCNCKDKEA